MTKADKKIMSDIITDTIKATVNGKIDKLHEMMNDHQASHIIMDSKIEAHIKRVEPYIEAYEGTKSLAKGLVFWGLFISTIAGAIFAIKQVFK